MRKPIRLSLLMACMLVLPLTLQAQTFQWAKQLGGTSTDRGNSIAVDASGNVYTTGYFAGTADFDPGAGTFHLTSAGYRDIFISKLDTNGNFVWAKQMGGTAGNQGVSIAVDASGNVYTTGPFAGTADFDPGAGTFHLTSAGDLDIFISKLDANGNFEWAKRMGGTAHDIGLSIALDDSSNVYTTGTFQGTADFDPGAGIFNLTSAGDWDIFISKLDADGNFVWAKQMGGTGDDDGVSIAVDAWGNVYTTGAFQETVDFDPGAGTFHLTSAGYRDIFISKLDTNGNFVWAKRMGGTSDDQGYSIAVDASGNVYTTGYFSGTADFDPGAGTFNLTSAGNEDIFISKLDASGNFVWAKHMGGTAWNEGLSIALDASGNVYTTGRFAGTADFDPGTGTFYLTSAGGWDIFISKLDANGNFVWAKQMGGSSSASGNSVAVEATGNVYTTGEFRGTADFNPGSGIFNLTSAGNWDIFIHKMSKCTPPALSTSTIPPICLGGTGSALVSASGGPGPYTYLWSNSQTTSAITGIPAGTYTVTVTDSASCSAIASVTITEPPMLAAVLSATASRPTPNCDGTATATASGGTSPYAYAWSNGATGETISGLCAGMYEVTITDSSGCTRTDSISVPLHTGMAGQVAPGAVSVYPNPTTGMLSITASEIIGAVRVFDFHGRLVQSTHTDSYVIELDLSRFPDGIYMIEALSHHFEIVKL